MKKLPVFFLLFAFLFIEVDGFGSLKARSPGTNENFSPLWLTSLDAKVTINDQIAVTFIDQVFANTTSSKKEGIFEFSIPEGAVIVELALWINGIRQIAKSVEKTKAKSTFDNAVRLDVDPALLECVGDNKYQVNIYPIDPAGSTLAERRIDMTYCIPLKSVRDTIPYFFALATEKLSDSTPQRISLSASIFSQNALWAVLVNSPAFNEVLVTKNSEKSYNLLYGKENAHATKDLSISIIPKRLDSFQVTAATYEPGADTLLPFDSTGDNSYFSFWLNAPPLPSNNTSKTRQIVFVIDASFSMSGNKITMLKESLQHALHLLSEADQFSVITFNTSFTAFSSTLVPATPLNISNALNFIQTTQTKGITNPLDALIRAMTVDWSSSANTGILFLTDGFPTWPIRRTTESMIDTITKINKSRTKIYSIGIGEEADFTFLSLLSQRNNGTAVTLSNADTINGGLTKIVEQMLYPLLYDFSLTYSGWNPVDVYPAAPSTIFYGDQVYLTGRYAEKTNGKVIVNAKCDSKSVQETLTVTLPVSATNYQSIPQLWASAKVDRLLEEIKLHGELPELKNAVIALGLRYGIVTDYTSLLVIESQNSSTTNSLLIDKTAGTIVKMELSAQIVPHAKRFLIRYSIPYDNAYKTVSLKVYNLRGELVQMLAEHKTRGGRFILPWDCKGRNGTFLSAGSYLLVLKRETGKFPLWRVS